MLLTSLLTKQNLDWSGLHIVIGVICKIHVSALNSFFKNWRSIVLIWCTIASNITRLVPSDEFAWIRWSPIKINTVKILQMMTQVGGGGGNQSPKVYRYWYWPWRRWFYLHWGHHACIASAVSLIILT